MKLVESIKKYKGMWIALNNDDTEIVGFDKSYNKALELAKKKGYKEPVMMLVPKKNYSQSP